MTGRRDDVAGLIVCAFAVITFGIGLAVLVVEHRVGGAILTGPLMALVAIGTMIRRWRRGGE